MIVPMSESPARASGVRDATPADRPAIAAILAANDEPVEWQGVPGWPHLDHLLDRARTVVAVVDGVIGGFAACVTVGPIVHVSDLFVDPTRQGEGLGSALMADLRATDADRPWTTFSSADPRALALYLRSGMRPWWPNLYIVAESAPDPARSGGLEASIVAPSDALGAERELTGIDRSAEYDYWGSLPGAKGIIVADRRGTRIAAGIATAMRRTDGTWVKHLVAKPGASADASAAAVLVALATLPQPGHVGLSIPGPHPAVAALLGHGFRIADRDTFCATDVGLIDPLRVVLDASFL